ncbi:DNA cytosine methyltransferase [Capnocytophaga canimorsus]|uniref:DNA cytosine methyltransferase n=1 Tax=Capnocytophaga canimorsus TaxID=28188 RepID=UPI0020B15041|nr:DNA cytosine methyltransferase [Capnocytophaga canimorsus]
MKRIENRDSNFNAQFIYADKVPLTLVSTDGSKMTLFDEPRKINHTEIIRCQSFPQDYDFGTNAYSFIKYVLGMSVPPVMMANLVDEIYEQWKEIFN